MPVSKDNMSKLTTMLNDSSDGHAPEYDDDGNLVKPDAGAVDTGDDLGGAGGDDDDVVIYGDAENGFTDKDGKAVNEQGQLIDDEGKVIDADPDADPDAGPNQDAGDDPEGTYTPSKLAEAIGWETEDLYNSVMIPMDDGQPAVPLGELKNTHQNLVRDHEALKTQMTEQSGMLQQAQTGFNQGQQMSAEMMEAQSYLASVNRMEEGTDWKELEELDPSQAVLKRQKFAQARQDIGQQIQQIEQKQGQMRQYYLQQAGVKTVELIPSWSDGKAKQADQDVMRVHMRSRGFVDQEIDQIADPRVMQLMKELIDLRAEKASAKKAVKKVRQAPKVLAGNRGVRRAKAGEQTQTLVKKAKQTGNKDDKLNAVKSLIKQNQK